MATTTSAQSVIVWGRRPITGFRRWNLARSANPNSDLNYGLIVSKETIAANGDYNLSAERYRVGTATNHRFPQVELGSICKPEYGFTASAEDKGDARFVRITDIGPDGRIRKDEPKFIRLTVESEPYLLKK